MITTISKTNFNLKCCFECNLKYFFLKTSHQKSEA